MITRTKTLALVLLLVVLAALPATADHQVLRGKSYYYGDQYVGGTMACGGTYRHWKMVAAHLTLPCGTRIRVRNTDNGNVVSLRVRDRGPYSSNEDMILDVSRRAAKRLDFITQGIANVKVTILHD